MGAMLNASGSAMNWATTGGIIFYATCAGIL